MLQPKLLWSIVLCCYTKWIYTFWIIGFENSTTLCYKRYNRFNPHWEGDQCDISAAVILTPKSHRDTEKQIVLFFFFYIFILWDSGTKTETHVRMWNYLWSWIHSSDTDAQRKTVKATRIFSTDHSNNSIIRLKAWADFRAAGVSLRKSVWKRLFQKSHLTHTTHVTRNSQDSICPRLRPKALQSMHMVLVWAVCSDKGKTDH